MKYLLVDDDIRVYSLIQAFLNPDETLVYRENLDDILNIINNEKAQLVIFDINLENTNGLEFFSQNKSFFKERGIQVFFLSQIEDLKAKLEAFQFGADDYIVKPFEPLELMARVRSKIKNINHSSSLYVKGDMEFDLSSNSLFLIVDEQKQLIDLSYTEFKLIHFLAKNEGKVFSRDSLLDLVWGRDVNVIERTVDQHVSKLRKKVKSNYFEIKTVFNSGYCLGALGVK